jgi:SAM-dependent methyltransferase
MSDVDEEIARIEDAYRRRDSAGTGSAYSFSNRAYVLYVESVERATLSMLRASSMDLTRARVLDVGCGSGYFLHRLVEYGAQEAAGVDLMENRVAEALRRYPALDVRQGDATALPFEDASFGLVVQYGMLSSVLDAGTRGRIGSEMRRVVAPGGTLLSFDIAPPSALIRAIRWLVEAGMRARGSESSEGTPIAAVSAEELSRIFGLPPLATRSVVPHTEIARLVGGSPLATELLSCVPQLRTHLIATFRKT